jgi:hypothetical protein
MTTHGTHAHLPSDTRTQHVGGSSLQTIAAGLGTRWACCTGACRGCQARRRAGTRARLRRRHAVRPRLVKEELQLAAGPCPHPPRNQVPRADGGRRMRACREKKAGHTVTGAAFVPVARPRRSLRAWRPVQRRRTKRASAPDTPVMQTRRTCASASMRVRLAATLCLWVREIAHRPRAALDRVLIGNAEGGV